MRCITHLEVAGELSLRLSFDDGSVRLVNFAHLPAKGGVFARLANPEYFRSVRIALDGSYLEWPNDLDMCADALWLEGVPVRETA